MPNPTIDSSYEVMYCVYEVSNEAPVSIKQFGYMLNKYFEDEIEYQKDHGYSIVEYPKTEITTPQDRIEVTRFTLPILVQRRTS